MTIEEQLQIRLKDEEDALVERKSAAKHTDVRKAVCGFANSVREPDTGVLFLGVDRKGETTGRVNDPDKTQIEVRSWCSQCYPPIGGIQTYALEVGNKHVVAVVVPGSRDRPHFTGPAFIRDGSETREANEEQFERLVEDRNDLVWALRPYLGQAIALVEEREANMYIGRSFGPPEVDVTLQGVNQHFATIKRGGNHHPEAFSLKRVYLERCFLHDGTFLPQLRVRIG